MTFAVYGYQSKSRTSLIGLLTVFGSIKWMKHSEFKIWKDTVHSFFHQNTSSKYFADTLLDSVNKVFFKDSYQVKVRNGSKTL